MTAIVTVHGTFSSGATDGDKWWQRNSTFATRLLEVIEAPDGIRHEPFVWTGANSETSRWSAGKDLLRTILTLEAKQEPYALIGHSHGGSVISAALLEAARRRESLPHMKAWATVGTPFLRAKRKGFLYNRMGVLGKTAFVVLLCSGLVVHAKLVSLFDTRAPVMFVLGIILAALACYLPLIVFAFVARQVERERLRVFDPAQKKRAAAWFGQRWVPFYHASDEAILALGAAREFKVDLFPSHFAVAPLTAASILIFPIALASLMFSNDAVRSLGQFVASTGLVPAGFTEELERTIAVSNSDALFLVLGTPFVMMVASIASILDFFNFREGPFYGLIIIAFGVITPVLLIAWFIRLAMVPLAILLSKALSAVLNPLTAAQMRSLAFGADTSETVINDVGPSPEWLPGSVNFLSPALAAELLADSDRALSQNLPRFRSFLLSLSSAQSFPLAKRIDDYLDWNAIIHSGYFSNPRFCSLMAYALCQKGIGTPGASFRREPDFPLLDAWYREAAASPLQPADAQTSQAA
ncbi:MAG: hypothetical protein AB7S70_01420 [Hyphomicrobium sp.]|uniref:hypothetical protein n=1 Tax=Hyphomicrobium sp. TaxID=82 RepID=UPI003D0B3736